MASLLSLVLLRLFRFQQFQLRRYSPHGRSGVVAGQIRISLPPLSLFTPCQPTLPLHSHLFLVKNERSAARGGEDTNLLPFLVFSLSIAAVGLCRFCFWISLSRSASGFGGCFSSGHFTISCSLSSSGFSVSTPNFGPIRTPKQELWTREWCVLWGEKDHMRNG